MTTQPIAVRNDFHNTTCTLRAKPDGTCLLLSPSQVRRCRAVLCGSPDCTCGDAIKQHGVRHDWAVNQTETGGAELTRAARE